MATGVHEDVLGVLDGRIKGHGFLAEFGGGLVNVVPPEVNLAVVGDVVLDEPVGGVIKPAALICLVGRDPL